MVGLMPDRNACLFQLGVCLPSLCLCVSVVNVFSEFVYHRDTETQRKAGVHRGDRGERGGEAGVVVGLVPDRNACLFHSCVWVVVVSAWCCVLKTHVFVLNPCIPVSNPVSPVLNSVFISALSACSAVNFSAFLRVLRVFVVNWLHAFADTESYPTRSAFCSRLMRRPMASMGSVFSKRTALTAWTMGMSTR